MTEDSIKRGRGGKQPGAGRPSLKPEHSVVVAAIQASQGMAAGAARALGVSRRTLLTWVDSDQELKAEMNDQREILKDRLEGVAYNRAIEEGDTSMIQFLLRTVGRSRGYSERTELTGPDGGDLVLTLRPPSRSADE